MDHLLLLIIAQVVLESIPISSSGHLTLGTCMLAVPMTMTSCKAVYYALHGPTALVLLAFFYNYWRRLISWRPFIFFVVLELVTLGGFLLCAPFVAHAPLCIGFCITALALFSLRLVPRDADVNTWRLEHALIIGGAQALAFMPGVSRFGSTFAAACWCRLPTRDAFAIACLAEVPIALFGCVLGCSHIIGTPVWDELTRPAVLMVIVGATILSYIVLGGVWYLAEHNRLWRLCWYMLLPIGVSCIM